jgi:hypothetical protein
MGERLKRIVEGVREFRIPFERVKVREILPKDSYQKLKRGKFGGGGI